MIRDKNTQRADFIFYSNRIIRLLVEEGLNHLPVVEHSISTPVGRTYAGVMFQGKICGVSIMRAGEAMEQGLRDCCRSVRIGKILIQRDEETSMPKLFYDKLPDDIAERWVLLLDPMFATGEPASIVGALRANSTVGGSATMAVDVLKSRGVPENRILFLNLIASPEGIDGFAKRFPKLRVVTAFIDQVSGRPHNRTHFLGTCPWLTLIRDLMRRSKSQLLHMFITTNTDQLYCARSRGLWR
jgi:uracil phosphoribosyltransferase